MRLDTAVPGIALADWTDNLRRSVLREMLAVVSRPGILSFAGGLPAPELFPTAEYAQAVEQVLSSDPKALQYGPPFAPLKAHIVRLMAERGVSCREEQIFITTGAQQALSILSRLLLNPGGQLILEELVYSGLQQAVTPFMPDRLLVSTDLDQGIDVEAVEEHLVNGARPAFLYVNSIAHNPLGVTISEERGWRLIELARRYSFPIVEDDPYGFLQYDGQAVTPLRALDDHWVFYVGSFSKILAPALRLGWMVVPESLTAQLTVVKESEDLESSAFTQRAVSAYLDAGHLPAHLERLIGEYRRRRDTMLAALGRHFPEGARWSTPSAGMFIWVEFPAAVDATDLLQQCVADIQVAFIPGSAFRVDHNPVQAANGRPGQNCLRLNFSHSSPELIEEGIARMGQLLHRHW